MRKVSPLVTFLLWVAAATSVVAHAGDVIDRIVATVNGHVILQSDWDDAVRFEAFLEGRPLDQLSDQDRSRALDRLIDQELLREQAQGVEAPQPPADEMKQRMQELQAQHAATSPEAWRAALARYGFDEKQLEARVAHDIATLRQVEARLRPSVQIDNQTIESYYRDKFLPKLRDSGAQEVPLATVSGKIREILTEEKVNQLFSSWLQSLRAESKIHTSVAISSPPAPVGGQE
jgi:peptidyl-prolyl cis-trans isomerase SurA